MKYIIPIDAVPSQSFSVEIEGKECFFEFLTAGLYIYMNMSVNDVRKISGVICLNKNKLNEYDGIGIKGDIHFEDTQGELDPIYYGLGDRWILVYEGDNV